MIATLLASFLTPFFVEYNPEIRTTYQSLGKIVEDAPMQITDIRAGVDAGPFGRFGIQNWDVSSLTDRRDDVHRHALYHTEFNPFWQYTLPIVEAWSIKSDLRHGCTIYDGFVDEKSDKTYLWWQLDQSLENPFLVPFYRLRRTYHGSDYFYFKVGLRRKCPVWSSLSLTPSVFVEGGNGRNLKRVFGSNINGGDWGAGGAGSLSFKLEASWRFNEWSSVFVYVEQYEVVGNAARDTNATSSNKCLHNDWTHGGIGLRFSF